MKRLHPEAAAMLREAARAGPPPGDPDFDLHRARNRPAPQRPTEKVAHLQDINVADLRFRLYRPSHHCEDAVVLYLHGGGWVLGDLDTGDDACRRIARRSGWTVLNFDYPLAPEHPYPSALNAIHRLLEWMTQRGSALGLNGRRVALIGESAGGNLAAATAHRLTAETGTRRVVSLLALLSPVLDLTHVPTAPTDFPSIRFTPAAMKWCVDRYTPHTADRLRPAASPLRADDLTHMPPTLIFTGEVDILQSAALAYSRRLEAAGVSCTLTSYPGMPHDLGSPRTSATAASAFDHIATALRDIAKQPSDPENGTQP